MGEHRRGDAADRNEAQDRDRESSHFQVQIDGIHHSRSTSRRKTVREARVRTAAIVERDARMGGGWPPLGVKSVRAQGRAQGPEPMLSASSGHAQGMLRPM
jgi:hypothetical protein